MAHTRFLWVDVDKPGELPALWGLLAERPCHLLVESAGSGGMHAYWQLAEPLPAVTIDPDSGERVEWIKRANLRLIHRIGTGPDGRPSVADEMCAEQARVMRPLSVGRSVSAGVWPARSFADASVSGDGVGWR